MAVGYEMDIRCRNGLALLLSNEENRHVEMRRVEKYLRCGKLFEITMKMVTADYKRPKAPSYASYHPLERQVPDTKPPPKYQATSGTVV